MPGPLAGALLFGTLWMVPLALMPLAIGRAVDAVIAAPAFGGTLWNWLLVIAALGTLQVASVGLLEYCSSLLWVRSAVRAQLAVLRHATQVGAALPRKIRAGEVAAIGSSDVYQIGKAFEGIGRLFGSLVAFGLAVSVVLARNPLLGTVVLVGVPLATAGLAPLLGPLRRRTEAHREQVGAATTIAADIVSGLRVLRGIGGERRFAERFTDTSQRVRWAGVRTGRIDSWLSGVEVLLPGLITVVVTWLGARLALGGTITVGELVGCYGLSAFLVIPVAIASETVHAWSGALVAAGRTLAVLRLGPELTSPSAPTPLPAGPLGLRDPELGLTCPPGALTVIQPTGPHPRADSEGASQLRGTVGQRSWRGREGHSEEGREARRSAGRAVGTERGGEQSSTDLADRLGRFRETPVLAIGPDGEVPLRNADLVEVRRRIVVAHNQDVLFSGRLADEVQLDRVARSGNPAAGSRRVDLDAALWGADASDVVAGLDDGVDEQLTERGRRLSGGQRQRLMLARALTADADVLVLDEPTSAVDAHTEARIARRVAELRAGRSTVVISASPLWAAVADEVASGAVTERPGEDAPHVSAG